MTILRSILCSSDAPSARRSVRRASVRVFAVLCAAFGVSTVVAAPYIPASDAVVLERLPASEATRQLLPLRKAVSADPKDLHSALQLARGYLEIGRSTSDPRFVAYALATLEPWMREPSPPVAVIVMQATVLQNMHRFDASLELLDRALVLVPDDPQALLTKATLLQVQGKFDAARSTCKRLFRSADQAVAVTCTLTVDSLNGKLEPSYAALQLLGASPSRAPQLDAWMLGQLAEMSVRRADFAAAEREFKAARARDPDDVYLRGALADLLLLQQRDRDVIELLREYTAHDVLLLRLAIAGRRAGDADARQWAETFDARRRATRPDDNPHLREHARFLLDVLDRPQEALELARRNWRIQREPADLQVYARSAVAAASAVDEEVVRDWIAATAFEDRTLQVMR